MKTAIAQYEFRNGDIDFNLKNMERAIEKASGKADIVVFGESFLQGFDALCWDFDTDKAIAIEQQSETMRRIERMSREYGTDIVFGYFELDGESIYSSCAVIEGGRLTQNYRRISVGWREPNTDWHYKEGNETCEFDYRGQKLMLALCGDMWDMPERFKTNGVLVWPVYINFPLDEWRKMEHEYAEQALLAAGRALLVNPISHDPDSIGGAFCFERGRIEQRLDYGEEGLLFVEL
ncbi:MAG: carbon-nitrogen hydrolase family protein [Clostridia bacterium]|nr:carbon-nitrogen hydrolase family protein [Clostridia bacterium]